MSERIRICALGGLNENGKNLTIIQINNDIFVIDAGIKYPDKSLPGIDYIIADYSFLKENKDKIKAYFITHGHDDQIGAITYIVNDCPAPIFCTDITKEFIELFARHINVKIKADFCIIEPTSETVIANRKINFFATCHNMPKSFGIAIETINGNIVYCTDFIIENINLKNFNCDFNIISQIVKKNKTLILMTESIFATNNGYTSPRHRLTRLINNSFENAINERIIIAISSTNIFAIYEIIKLAILYNRKIYAYDNETFFLLELLKKYNKNLFLDNIFFNCEKDNYIDDQNIIIIIAGFNSALYYKINYFVKNSNHFVQLKKNDTFILAVPPNNNFEKINAKTLDNIFKADIKNIISISKKEYFDMHASVEDLKTIISLFKPKYYFPIKGNYNDILANAMIAYNMDINLSHENIFILENGNVLEIENNVAKTLSNVNNINTGSIFINGNDRINSLNNILNDKINISNNGIIIISVVISYQTHKIISLPEITSLGFKYLKDFETLSEIILKNFNEVIEKIIFNKNINKNFIEKKIVDQLSKLINNITNQQPLILPIILYY